MALEFEITRRSYAIEIEHDRFLDLLDSESYVTDNAAFKGSHMTLCQKLDKLPGVTNVEYSGHFGAAVYLAIDDEDDCDDLKSDIVRVIEEHLRWCAMLPKRTDVVRERAATRSGSDDKKGDNS